MCGVRGFLLNMFSQRPKSAFTLVHYHEHSFIDSCINIVRHLGLTLAKIMKAVLLLIRYPITKKM